MDYKKHAQTVLYRPRYNTIPKVEEKKFVYQRIRSDLSSTFLSLSLSLPMGIHCA